MLAREREPLVPSVTPTSAQGPQLLPHGKQHRPLSGNSTLTSQGHIISLQFDSKCCKTLRSLNIWSFHSFMSLKAILIIITRYCKSFVSGNCWLTTWQKFILYIERWDNCITATGPRPYFGLYFLFHSFQTYYSLPTIFSPILLLIKHR